MSERPNGYNPEENSQQNEEPLEFGVGEDSQGRPSIGGTLKGLEQLNEMYSPDTPIKDIIDQMKNSGNN